MVAAAFAENTGVACCAPRKGNHVLKKSLPRAAYEDLVVLQVRKGLNMEDFNHPGNFIATPRYQIHGVILSGIASYISTQQCVSLVVDKITIWKRTLWSRAREVTV